MAKYVIFCALPLLLFASGCRPDSQGDRLFDIVFPVTEFAIPAGQAQFRSFVVALPQVETDFTGTLARNNLDAADVDLVGGLRARVVSLTGDDWGEFERVELRVCPVGQENGCDQFDLMFSVDDLFRRRQLTVNLNPGLRNHSDLFMDDQVRVELIFTAGNFTSAAMQGRLEWSVQAVGNLD